MRDHLIKTVFRLFVLGLLLFSISFVSFAQKQKKTRLMRTQTELNIEANQKLMLAEDEMQKALNLTLQAVWADTADSESVASDRVLKQMIQQQQLDWIRYRDNYCESIGMYFTGGSIRPLMILKYGEMLTRNRIRELKMLQELFNWH